MLRRSAIDYEGGSIDYECSSIVAVTLLNRDDFRARGDLQSFDKSNEISITLNGFGNIGSSHSIRLRESYIGIAKWGRGFDVSKMV